MLDKILIVSKNQAYIYFTHRPPVGVYSSSGQVVQMVDELLCPPNNAQATTLTEYQRIEAVSEEDTQIIPLDQVS